MQPDNYQCRYYCHYYRDDKGATNYYYYRDDN